MAPGPFTFPYGPSPDQAHVLIESSGGGDTSLWVALASALFAGFAVVLTLWRDYNDRPRLVTALRIRWKPGPELQTRVHVTNVGRRAVTVGPLTLLWDLSNPWGDLPSSGEIAIVDPADRHVLEPGQTFTSYWAIPAGLPLHAQTPLRAAAYPTRGRPSLSEPVAILARLPPSVLAASQLGLPDAPLLEPLRLRRVVARWKLWKPRHLRTEATDRELTVSVADLERGRDWLAVWPPTSDWTRPEPGRGTWHRKRF